MMSRKIVVGFSGGVTSAWCAGWALRNFPREEVVLLWHDTKEEDADTYRFLKEMSTALGMPITERSDGRSVTEVARDEGMVPNDRAAFCSRILKQEQGNRFIAELQERGATEIIKVMGFSRLETERMQRHTALAWGMSTLWCPVVMRFPVFETKTTKQQCADWCNCEMGVPIPAMYSWSDHANCPGCFRGKKAYWIAVAREMPEVFKKRSDFETEMGHTVLDEGPLVQIVAAGLKRKVNRKESIEIGPCECGS